MANSSNQLLELIPPYRGSAGEVSLILNVSDRVGLGQVNKRHDVWTVQILMWYASSHTGADMKFGLPQLNGLFDAVTGLWIFHIQNLLKNRYGVRHQVVDGIVSPHTVLHSRTALHGRLSFSTRWRARPIPDLTRALWKELSVVRFEVPSASLG